MRAAPLALVLVLGLAAPARAAFIDDFEVGPFALQATTATDAVTQPGLPPANVIGGTRFASATPDDATANEVTSSTLVLTLGADDAVQIVTPASGGVAFFSYAPLANVDLTVGGTLDRILVTMPSASIGGALDIGLSDSSADQTLQVGFGGPGVAVLLMSQFDQVDVTDVTRIMVSLHATGAGSFAISEISAAAAVPEPASALLLVAALAAVAARRRASRRA